MDNQETIELDLNHDELFQLMLMAHEQDITFNQLVENILKGMCDSYEKTDVIE
jgi:hypothetical protein